MVQKRKKANKKKSIKAKPTRKAKKAKKTKKTNAKKVTAVPYGYHSITPYLIVDRGSDAIEFYKKAFGAKEVLRIKKPNGKIGHAELKIGDAKIMLADEFPEMGIRSPKSYNGSGTALSIHLYIKNVDSVIENALLAGALLERPAENMFYGDRAGTITDPFGYHWHVSTHIENVTPAELRKRTAIMYENK